MGEKNLRITKRVQGSFLPNLIEVIERRVERGVSSARDIMFSHAHGEMFDFVHSIKTKKAKKKIIITSYDDISNPYYAGGGSRSIHTLSKLLKKQFDITVVTGNYQNAVNGVVDGVSYKRVGPPWLGAKTGQVAFQLITPFYLLSQKFDICVESFTPPFSFGLSPLLTNKPVIGLIHMLPGEDMRRKYIFPFDLLEKITIKNYKYIIATSTSITRKIGSIHPNGKVLLIPNGITIPKKNSSKKGKNILYLGRIEVNQKGLDLLLDALKMISIQEKVQLVIAGNGQKKQLDIVKKKIKDLGLENVTLKGKVEGAEKERLYQEALCVVVPSRFETFSIVSLEALSYGRALVTFDIEGLKWIPNNCRFVARQMTSNSLSKAIVKALSDKKMATQKRSKGSEFVNQFEWSEVSKKYVQLFSQIV